MSLTMKYCTAVESDSEQSEAELAGDSGSEADGCLMRSVTVKVEHYRSYEYQIKWPTMVNTRHSGKLKKTLKTNVCKSLTSPQEIQKWPLSDYSRRKTQRQAVNSDEGGAGDLIDLIGREQELLSASDGGRQSDEDSRSSVCSFASGPSRSYQGTASYLCSSCLRVFERAKKMKTIKDKVLDNNPRSLSCDQWVLLKKWRVSRRPNTEGKLLQHVCRIVTRLKKQSPKQNEQSLESDCSRPHSFLRRNLRVKPKPRFKKQRNKRKRSRQASQGPRSAKQQRLHGNSRQALPPSISSTQSDHTLENSSTGFWDGDGSSELIEESTMEVAPVAVSMATHPNRDFIGKLEEPLKQTGFRELLAQLSNTSTIIREKRERKYEL